MYHVVRNYQLLLLGFMVIATGCSSQKTSPATDASTTTTVLEAAPEVKKDATPQPAVTPVASSEKSPSTPDKADKPAKQDNSTQSPPALVPTRDTPRVEQAVAPDVKPLKESAYFPNEVVGLAVLHPRSFFETPIGRLLLELGFETDSGRPSDLLQLLGLKFADLERVTVVIDQSLVSMAGQQLGLPVPGVGAGEEAGMALQGRAQVKNALKQFGLGFHNYHDVYRRFPRADGDGSGEQTGLSWRVYLLPFIDQLPLYNQFHLDEPWDSDHNKELISQMPPIFKSPGVTEEGKTAYHVITGPKSLFEGEKGPQIQQITDGTSYTIMAIQAGADKADIWTRPGGLEVDLEKPLEGLGKFDEEDFMALFADGHVEPISTKIDPATLAKLIQPNDGNPVRLPGADLPGGNNVPPTIEWIPSAILSLSKEVSQPEFIKHLLKEPVEESFEGTVFHKNRSMAVWFADPQTVIVGAPQAVKQMISAGKSGSAKVTPLAGQLNLGASVSMAIDLQSQAAWMEPLLRQNAMLGMIANIKTVSAQFSGTGEKTYPLFGIDVTAIDASMAGGLFAMASMGLNQGKMGVAQLPIVENASKSDVEMMKFVKGLVASATLDQHEDQIHFQVPVPKEFDRMPEILKPALVAGRNTAQLAIKMNALREVGTALHNFHDLNDAFPGVGRAKRDQANGLSWRVAILPFLGQNELYREFKLDEPWDSEHNQTLIKKMPLVYKSIGVEDPEKTSVHLLTGPGAPFADDATPMRSEFTDGLSSSILAVMAGPDTAEVWTKPGGLSFDPADPIKAMGQLVENRFLALFGDGTVITINEEIEPEQLLRLMQMADGQ